MLNLADQEAVDLARDAAAGVLLHNARGPHGRLPRTAGWGYPEPYTRDLMISSLGFLVSGEPRLVRALEQTLVALAKNQTSRGHIPSLAHDPNDRGASDTTPLFLIGLSAYRKHVGDNLFLQDAAERALTWLAYQSPDDMVMVAQLPTSDWRDEQSVFGYGLYVNALVHTALCMMGRSEEAARLRDLMNRLEVQGPAKQPHVHEGLAVRKKPYFALYSYKVYNSDRFDLLGNSLAVLCGIASHSRAASLVRWVETECRHIRDECELRVDLPPCLFPFIRKRDPDWRTRYEQFNQPGEYHNGGVWPFICGFYVAACVAAGRQALAERNLVQLARLVRLSRDDSLEWGFNEWIKAQNGRPRGQDWQTWSAAVYLYAVECVRTQSTPFFDQIRVHN